jgi:hypothetical protein
MANHLKLSAEKKADFLAALSLGSTATAAAGASGVALRTFYDHKGSDPEFRDAWEEAYREGTELLEDEARRRGAEGWDEPVYYQGRVVGHVRRYSDTLLMFVLKARDRARYSDKSDVHLSGGVTLEQMILASMEAEAGE